MDNQGSGGIVSYIEERTRLQPLELVGLGSERSVVPSGTTIAVVGGGLSGPAFARRVLTLAAKLDIDVQIELLTRPSCNYCAGLITNISLHTMRNLYDLSVPPEVIKESIFEVVYMNRHGSVTVPLADPLTSVLRTSRFKQRGFDESWIESVFKGLHSHENFRVHTDARVTNIKRKESGGFKITYDRTGSQLTLDAEVVVLATGLKSIQQPFMQRFIAEFGYKPPGLMDSCVTEINTACAEHYDLAGRVLVVDGVIKNCIAAFIPKGRDWLTVTGLGKVLADHDMEVLFNQPLVRRYIRLEHVIDHLRCRKICSATVVTHPGARFYGDGWVMIGDLTGYGRALKDGYFASLQSADLAAKTILLHGTSQAAFRENYLKPLRKLATDNRVGMWLFWLDQRIAKGRVGTRLLASALRETRKCKYGGLVTAAFRALFSGELSYKWISGLFMAGVTMDVLKSGFRRKPADADQVLRVDPRAAE